MILLLGPCLGRGTSNRPRTILAFSLNVAAGLLELPLDVLNYIFLIGPQGNARGHGSSPPALRVSTASHGDARVRRNASLLRVSTVTSG